MPLHEPSPPRRPQQARRPGRQQREGHGPGRPLRSLHRSRVPGFRARAGRSRRRRGNAASPGSGGETLQRAARTGLSCLQPQAVRRPEGPSSDRRWAPTQAGQAHDPLWRPSSASVRPRERRPPRSTDQRAVSPRKVSSGAPRPGGGRRGTGVRNLSASGGPSPVAGDDPCEDRRAARRLHPKRRRQ
jgi:hypothetical protein